ncbi:inactive ubiquitin carboxyl-terminal hydrolase MINDY-4B [Melanerpes formicivorus]|uniref:inactive ubiquitin carboxyl-terminal hydrolase MINDY-4B n=1 Tax=Melanerpes formicivorus TaxID=211600 RepID=UPI00358F3730
MAQTQLEEIASRISDLNKWRDIFSFHGLEISNGAHQPGRGNTGDGTPAAGEPRGLQPPDPSCAIPVPLLVPVDAGGQPISLDMAMGLRKLLLGKVSHVFSCEWTKAHFRFRQPCSDLAYGLEADKGGTRAILMAVQAHIIRHLLFGRNTAETHLERLQGVGRGEQGEALAAALTELLWAAGGGGRATVCLVTTATHFVPCGDYRADSFTERIQLFEFWEKAAAQEFISDHINCFRGKGSHGVILFVYSLLFSRTLERVQEDLKGTATPLLKLSLGSISCTQVCPGLRTPQVPIWLCSLCGRHGVLFSTNSLLLSCWRAERVFHLHFYNGQQEQIKPTQLTIDTHSHHWEEDQREDTSSPGKRRPPVEMAIRTKWAGATVSWNGTEPFF